MNRVFISACALLLGMAAPLRATPNEEIQTVLRAFMNGYWRSAETLFVSGDEVTRGWQTVHDRYKAKYSAREKMGTLTFSELEVKSVSDDAAVALGRWELKRKIDNPHGRFTLIFRKTPEGWRIVHDHTSAAEK